MRPGVIGGMHVSGSTLGLEAGAALGVGCAWHVLGHPGLHKGVAAGHVRLEVGRLRQRPAVKDRAVDAADHLDTTVMRLSDVSLFVYRYAWCWAGTRTSCKTRLMCQCVCNGVLKLLR
jgi:hypothetical protein